MPSNDRADSQKRNYRVQPATVPLMEGLGDSFKLGMAVFAAYGVAELAISQGIEPTWAFALGLPFHYYAAKLVSNTLGRTFIGTAEVDS